MYYYSIFHLLEVSSLDPSPSGLFFKLTNQAMYAIIYIKIDCIIVAGTIVRSIRPMYLPVINPAP